MTRHNLKLNDRYFEAVVTGKKTFEIRKNDRDYHVGDILDLRRVDDNGKIMLNKIGMEDICIRVVDYIITDREFPQGLKEGYAILGIKPVGVGD